MRHHLWFATPVLRCLIFVLICILHPLAHAETGKIRLTVVDAQTQRPLAEVNLTLTPREGPARQLSANDQGDALLEGLLPGLYDLLVSRTGYQTSRLPSVRVVDDKTTPLTIRLAPQRQNMEEVLVVGTAIGEDPLSSVGTSLIDREALRSAAGSGGDVLRALDGLPGLFSDGEYSGFTVRGAGPQDNLILVDGIPFDNVVHFNDSFGELEDVDGGGRYSVFAPNLIANAEFQPGGWNSAYGGKSGSLLKLNVAEGNPESASYNARLDVAGAEIGYDGPSRLHGNTSVLFSARSYNFERLFDIIGLEDIGAPKLTDIILKTATQLTQDDTLNFLAIYAPEEYTRDIDNVLASDEDEPGNYADVELAQIKRDNSLFALTWSRLIGSAGELANRIYLRQYDERSRSGEAYPDLYPPGTPAEDILVRDNILNARHEEQETGWHLDFFTDNRIGRLSSGLQVTQLDLAFQLDLTDDWIRYTYESEDFRSDPEQNYITLTSTTLDNRYEQKEVNYALFLDQEMSAGDWSFRAGARYDRDNFSDEDLISPRAGATWIANNALRITATAGRYFQAPQFSDRAADASNQNLENEVVDQISLGFNYRLSKKIDLFIESYYQDMANLVVEEDGVNQTLSNRGEGESYGVDTAITRQFDKGWSANFKYSYNQAQVKDSASGEYYDAEFSRPHSASIGGMWEINQRWQLSARWKWASGKPRDDYVIHDNVLGDGEPLRYSRETIAQNTGRHGSYNSLNFRADYRRAFGRTNLIAFIDVINLMGSDNPSNADFNERTGENLVEEGESIPLFGLMFEW
jgi:hypothetical protein